MTKEVVPPLHLPCLTSSRSADTLTTFPLHGHDTLPKYTQHRRRNWSAHHFEFIFFTTDLSKIMKRPILKITKVNITTRTRFCFLTCTHRIDELHTLADPFWSNRRLRTRTAEAVADRIYRSLLLTHFSANSHTSPPCCNTSPCSSHFADSTPSPSRQCLSAIS